MLVPIETAAMLDELLASIYGCGMGNVMEKANGRVQMWRGALFLNHMELSKWCILLRLKSG